MPQPAALPPVKRPCANCTEGLVGSKAGLDGCGKLCPTGIRSPDRSARSKSLDRLRYPGPLSSL